jgi:hypothetical protein
MRRAFRYVKRMGGMVSQVGIGGRSVGISVGVEPSIFKSISTPSLQSTAASIANNTQHSSLLMDGVTDDDDGT